MAEDRDIKIYVKKSDGETGEFQTLTQDIRQHISNGNRDKAISLGQKMAMIKPEDNAFDFNQYNFSASELYQIRVLLTFIAEYTVQKNISVSFLSDAVSSAMYDYLKINEKGYYDNISDGGAFTFYLLALKKSGDTAHNIGEEFAKRCGINKPEMINFGADIFNRGIAFFGGMIDATVFENV